MSLQDRALKIVTSIVAAIGPQSISAAMAKPPVQNAVSQTVAGFEVAPGKGKSIIGLSMSWTTSPAQTACTGSAEAIQAGAGFTTGAKGDTPTIVGGVIADCTAGAAPTLQLGFAVDGVITPVANTHPGDKIAITGSATAAGIWKLRVEDESNGAYATVKAQEDQPTYAFSGAVLTTPGPLTGLEPSLGTYIAGAKVRYSSGERAPFAKGISTEYTLMNPADPSAAISVLDPARASYTLQPGSTGSEMPQVPAATQAAKGAAHIRDILVRSGHDYTLVRQPD